MTANEWMVIIIAAAAFILINIIMWSIVAARHRSSAEQPEAVQPLVNQEESTLYIQPEHSSRQRKSSRRQQVTDFSDVPPSERKIREDFRLIDNIVIVHTNERL